MLTSNTLTKLHTQRPRPQSSLKQVKQVEVFCWENSTTIANTAMKQ